MLNNLVDKIKLPFRKEKELYLSLYDIIGCYPHNISYYKLALMHKSVARRTEKGKPANNERLEFLGDAILDAIVGDIVYQHFPQKREGFLTNTRSKIVQRDTLNRLAKEMGINKLLLSNGRNSSHNSYLGGNAFEALVGALYLDRGYDACRKFMEHRILGELINIDKMAYKETNFKSKLLEWSQKNRAEIAFDMLSERFDDDGNSMFCFRVLIEGKEGGEGCGYSKKESQQTAAKIALQKLRKDKKFLNDVLEAKREREEKSLEIVMAARSENEGGVKAAEDKAVTKPAEADTDAGMPVRKADKAVAKAGKDAPKVENTKSVDSKDDNAESEEAKPAKEVDLKALILEDSKRAAERNRRAVRMPMRGGNDEFDLSGVSLKGDERSREIIIAEAEEKAFGG